ncbi:hypothetical protein Rsub_06580 [Raphidocelis subcapitata]|uniref:PDZ domain-containing protein n=1 Tax=Raphidocelis subcapitata TaxID=307507 RepID=A0A2V0P8G4_9CHLO|nr:hypothetical protein Rsub_06580 [Raphidocelis subcapitata]|eukprot:GBF93447.1 hypothetical protein Rsub_06580 [Raphidocelis subcapitata]
MQARHPGGGAGTLRRQCDRPRGSAGQWRRPRGAGSTPAARRGTPPPAAAQRDEGPPAGCSRYTVELRRPLGVVLEQQQAGGAIVVASITAGGNADKTGQMTVGDQLISTSGVTYTRTEEYGGVNVRKGQEIVKLNCLGESFKTVSAAIGSHPASIPVRLTFQRCDPAAAAST